MKRVILPLLGACLLIAGLSAQRSTRIPVMLLDGNNNHRWAETSPVMEKVLRESGLFDVTVVTVPNAELPNFKPDWSRYRVVVMNYNTGINAAPPEWSDEVEASFDTYMKNGGGLVSIHATDNGFPNWKAFNEMIGVGGWVVAMSDADRYWYYKEDKLVRDETPGRGGAHGPRQPFLVTVRDSKHPITAGMPASWQHSADELYETMRGPGTNMTILATAPSLRTLRDEPMLMAINYGKGRVFHTTLGHDVNAMSSVDFVVSLLRGTEWAATGAVKQKVPDDFPRDPNVLAYRLDLAKMDPNYGQPPAAPGAGRGGRAGAAPVPPGTAPAASAAPSTAVAPAAAASALGAGRGQVTAQSGGGCIAPGAAK